MLKVREQQTVQILINNTSDINDNNNKSSNPTTLVSEGERAKKGVKFKVSVNAYLLEDYA